MIKAIITDIEGTTTSLAFVQEVLFPYARQHIADFICQHRNDPDVQQYLLEVNAIVGRELNDDERIKILYSWIDSDQKIKPLKGLQGMIWEQGYRSGDYTGHIYEDAVIKLRQWHQDGIKLFVFSSGSVKAQELIFGYSDAGDLRPLFNDYFDTRIGSKREVSAYQNIIDRVGLAADECLFLSDIEEELDAAAETGMSTIQLLRDESVQASLRHRHVASFASIMF